MDPIQVLLVFIVDPHIKVFRDDVAPQHPLQKVEVACARREFEPAQLVLLPSEDVEGVLLEAGELRNEATGRTLPAGTVRWNFVGFVPVTVNSPATAEDRLVRMAPCEIPDVLLKERAIDIKARTCQPVWLTFEVPADADPGTYEGKLVVRGSHGGLVSPEVSVLAELPVELVVWPFDLPAERHLYVTNWFSTSNIAQAHGVEEWSEPFWKLIEAYFRDMASHRQNVAWVPWSIIAATRGADGRLEFDFSRFDRYVEVMERCGVADRIEVQHVAHFGEGGWSGSTIEFARLSARDKATGQTVQLDFKEGLAVLLGALEKHLDARGWLGRTVIHIADEPSLSNHDSWCARSAELHEAAPRLKRIDAIEASDFSGHLEVWVPKLSHLNLWYPWFDAARRQGAELWFYICCHPYGGRYPNRFLDTPLIDVRLLHWLNVVYDLKGYLHWGWNHWQGDPFGPPAASLPPGDTHVIYPGDDGPLDSVRWEIQRESLEDFEYFWLLTSRLESLRRRFDAAAANLDPAQRARELARRLVKGPAELVRGTDLRERTRRQLVAEIIASGEDPPVLVNTRPDESFELVDGPIAIEVLGATDPLSKVTVNGAEVPVGPTGRFVRSQHIDSSHPVVRIVVTSGERTREIERRFVMRR